MQFKNQERNMIKQHLMDVEAASGITSYTETGNAEFSNNTLQWLPVDTEVKCLDALFIKRLLDKYTEQFLPDVPQLDYKKIDVRNAIKSIKDFYSAKELPLVLHIFSNYFMVKRSLFRIRKTKSSNLLLQLGLLIQFFVLLWLVVIL